MSERFIAVIGDIIASRQFQGSDRASLQVELEQLLNQLNDRYSQAIRSRFVITEGDSFQALLREAHQLPDIIWEIEAKLTFIDIRMGVGFGTVDTALREQAVGMDGPAFHIAREALKTAKKEKLIGGVFRGFGEFEDLVLNAFARLLRHMRSQLTDQQRTIANLLRQEPTRTQTSVANELGITRQAVSEHVRNMGWDTLTGGERAWRETLKRFSHGPVEFSGRTGG